jgi:hypothetical protein
MWKNPRLVEMLKSLPVGKTAKSPIKPDKGKAERELLVPNSEICTSTSRRYLTADVGSVTPLIAHR